MNMTRKIIPIKESFFNDGHWYVLTSTSLGGKNYGPDEISSMLQSEDPQVTRKLLTEGTCLPIYFPGDCALDQSAILIGDLSEVETKEWISCMRSKLEIPCGEFMLMGGAMPEHFEESIASVEPGGPNDSPCHKVELNPGSYLVEVYAFLGSMTVNSDWEEWPYDEALEDWWNRTRPDQEAEWTSYFREEECVDSEEFGLLEYIIRLAPLNDSSIEHPEIDEGTKWCAKFDMRKPDLCPLGLLRNKVFAE